MIPDFQTLMLPLLQQLADRKEHNIKNIVDALAVKFNLTEEEKNELIPSQRQPTIYNRVLWANTYLKKSGQISSPKRGVVRISKRGEDVLSQNVDKINISFLKRFPEFIEFQNRSKQDGTTQNIGNHINEDNQQDPLTTLLDAQTTINRALSDDLIEAIMSKDPYFFERVVVELLVKMGYSNESSDLFVTKKSGDDGVDGIIRMDKLGFDLIGVQAKRWEKDRAVGRPEVQAFAGILGGLGITNGVFFTTAKFTEHAKQYKHAGIKIILIDGNELTKLMITHNVGVQIERSIDFKKIDIDFFEEF